MYTLDKNVDFTLTVLSLVAEEESHKKSEAMNASYFMRYSQGDYMKPSLLGYRRVGVNEIAIDRRKQRPFA
jgi:DNA invertase Pin-like site-specific DNA recombinase